MTTAETTFQTPAPQSSYSLEELLACGRGEMFGPGNAQLPLPPMLMFHRITEISSDGGKYGKGYQSRDLQDRHQAHDQS